jgi:hypothetical protein
VSWSILRKRALLARLSCVYVRSGHGRRGWDLLRVIQVGLPTLRANNCLNSKHTSCLLEYYSDESVRCSVLGTIRHRTDMLRLARLSKPHSRACLPQIDRTKTARGDPRGISSRKNGIIISAKACLVNIGGCAQPKNPFRSHTTTITTTTHHPNTRQDLTKTKKETKARCGGRTRNLEIGSIAF